MNQIIEHQLAGFFAEVNSICGSEDTLHALFSHHLIMSGVDHRTVCREYRLDKLPVDIVIFDNPPDHGGMPKVAIEFKGGAYGTRNALFDTIDTMGHCRDLDKLQPFADAGMACWFICVDMTELGIALNDAARRKVAEQCRKRGICFAYFCQGEAQYLLETGTGLLEHQRAVSDEMRTPTTRPLPSGQDMPWVKRLGSLCAGLDASEDTYIALAYHALRESNYNVEQLSLETYFNCAGGGSRMQLRPDMAIFDSGVRGRFNLYRNGDPRTPNDAHKLAHLRAIVEVKGSAATAKLSDKRLAVQVQADISKLAEWRKRLCAAHPTSRACDAAYIMLVIDKAKRGASGTYGATLRKSAGDAGVELIYLGS